MDDSTRSVVEDSGLLSALEVRIQAKPAETPAQPPSDAAPLPNIPGYEILAKIGSGGIGVVFRARHLSLDRIVALKLLQGTQFDDDEMERFKREAQIAASLEHLNIVRVYEFGEYLGKPFLAMELCGGGSLEDRLRKSLLEPREAAQLLVSVSRAVQRVHDQNAIHRDLKPANILFAADQTPKVADFGLARRQEDSPLTNTNAIVGTPSYMSPEQATNGPLDCRSDVWSLGTILYESLTGKPPFKGANILKTLEQVVSGDVVAPNQIAPSVPRDLDTICRKCLEKSPAKRYASAAELADDLQRFLNGEPIRARRPSVSERVWRWTKRNKFPAALGATLVFGLSLVIVFCLMVLAWEREETAKKQRQEAELVNYRQWLAQCIEGTRGLASHGLRKEALTVTDRIVPRVDALVQQYPDEPQNHALRGQAYLAKAEMLSTSATEGFNDPAKMAAWVSGFLLLLPIDKKEQALLEEQLSYLDIALTAYQRAEVLAGASHAGKPSGYVLYRSKQREQPLIDESLTSLVDHATVGPYLRRGAVLIQLRRFSEAYESIRLGDIKGSVVFGRFDGPKQIIERALVQMAFAEQAKLPWSKSPKADHPKALRLAKVIIESPYAANIPMFAEAVFNAACAYAVAAAADDITAEEREERGLQAVKYLQQIAEKGYFNRPAKLRELQSDKDLDGVRKREDFQELVRKVTPKGS
jgi:hypothetical protein